MRAVGYACASPDERAPDVPDDVRERLGVVLPGAGLEAQRTAIADDCARRGWELRNVFVDADGRGPGRDSALEELEHGRADVLIAAKLDAIAPWSELPDLLNRTEREGWDLVALDLRLDTLSADGKAALGVLGSQARARPPSDLPMPPAELMFRVVGTDSPGRFEVGGRLQLEELDRVLNAHGRRLADFADILDFGCGPGRLLRQLRAMAPQARLCGVDQDEQAVGWVRRELPFVEAAVSPPLPPLAFPVERFDLIIVYSVFTHLDEDYQDAWLAELRRLTRPDGIVLATVHGMAKWQEIRDGPMARDRDRALLAAEFERRGFLHWTRDDWAAFFPDYYHTSVHRSDYVRDRWARWFEVVDVVAAQPSEPGHHVLSSGHDIVVLRRRRRSRRGGLLAAPRTRLRRSPLARELRNRLGIMS
jgi:SAM-dependent methyltransferase